MRVSVRVFVLGVASGSLAACAALTGLDGIEEDPCFPDLCADGSVAPDGPARPESGAPETRADGVDAPGEAPSDVLDEPLVTDAGLSTDLGQDAPVEAGPDGPTEADAPTDAVEAGCGTVYFQDSFADNTRGWTLDTTWSIAETCASPPAPQKGNPDPTSDHTATAGSGVVGAFVCGNNPAGQTTAFRYATSAAIDTSGAGTLKLGFWRWLNTDASGWMASTVDVYDGAAWVNVYTNPSGTGNLVTDAAWTREEYDVTAQKNAAFRVRFGYSLVDAGVYQMSAWNVDDLTVSTASCP